MAATADMDMAAMLGGSHGDLSVTSAITTSPSTPAQGPATAQVDIVLRLAARVTGR
jgi:hypothetical protein